MHIPKHFEPSDDAAKAFLATIDSGHLVTSTEDGLKSTFIPVLYKGDSQSIVGHLSRGNSQWKTKSIGEALFIGLVDDTYISPSWYATKALNGKVVPTWNYLMAHIYGDLVIHDDEIWLREQVTALSDKFENRRETPWSVEDAPEDYMKAQLRGIVGVELKITRLEVSFKMSQNKTPEDMDGVIAGLGADGKSDFAQKIQDLKD